MLLDCFRNCKISGVYLSFKPVNQQKELVGEDLSDDPDVLI